MKKNLLAVLSASLFLSLILLSGCTGTSDGNDADQTDTGHNFSFTLLDGTVKQLKDYRGKVVIMDLWATWCSPCQYQMLELRKAYQFYPNDQFEILSINTDPRESVSLIQEFLDEFALYGYDLDWVFAKQLDSLKDYNPSETIPKLVIFDQKGNIYWEHNGLSFFSEFPDGWTGELITLKEKIDGII
ncbi:MAG: TlpA disulfide reductase family protein [Candidatus Thermoplasmatota archaeon]|nr:TlpA disulfide reductase family protein [Candidatus Thermoplasmatota archaeon]